MNTNSVNFFKQNQPSQPSEDHGIILAVWEIGNPANIGQVIRLAHNVNAEKVFFVNDEVNFRESKIKKTSGFSYEQMDWEFISSSDFYNFLNDEFKLVVLETCDGSKNIYNVNLPNKVILLAGSESHGLPSEVIAQSNIQVHIPMPGACKSMNISHALSVASFEWYRQKINL